jgi:anti-sigma-K factor RskA
MNGEVHAISGAYALDAVSDLERRSFERHLSSCESCAEELRGFRLTTARLASVAATQPPASLRQRVLEAAASTPQERPTHTVMTSGEPRAGRTVQWLSAAAAVLLIATAALGAATYYKAQSANELSATAAAVAAVLSAPDAESVRGPVTGGGAGSVVVSREQGKAVVVTAGLEQPPSGSTYQLWAIGDEGAQSRGLLTPGEGGTAGDVVPWPADATTFGMTVEPAGGSEQPTTDPVLLLELPS